MTDDVLVLCVAWSSATVILNMNWYIPSLLCGEFRHLHVCHFNVLRRYRIQVPIQINRNDTKLIKTMEYRVISPHWFAILSVPLMFTLICVWINDWVNSREAGDLRCYRAHYDLTLMRRSFWSINDQEIKKMSWNANRWCVLIWSSIYKDKQGILPTHT